MNTSKRKGKGDNMIVRVISKDFDVGIAFVDGKAYDVPDCVCYLRGVPYDRVKKVCSKKGWAFSPEHWTGMTSILRKRKKGGSR
jgi:hypothetical protein